MPWSGGPGFVQPDGPPLFPGLSSGEKGIIYALVPRYGKESSVTEVISYDLSFESILFEKIADFARGIVPLFRWSPAVQFLFSANNSVNDNHIRASQIKNIPD